MFNKKPNILSLFFMIVLILISMGAAATKRTEKFQKTYDVKPEIKVDIYNINGNIEVSKWDKDELEVIAIKETKGDKEELDKVKIEVTTNGDMEIRTVYIDKKAKVVVNYEIKVPGNVVLGNIENSNGLIYIEGTKGPSVLETSNGRIEAKDVDGDLNLSTSNGSIRVENVRGYVNARTSNSSIDIKETEGISKVKTSNGSIKVEIPDIRGDKVDIVTSNGSIDVYINVGLDVDIEMDTSLGTVSNHNLPIDIIESGKTYIKGKLGNGGPKIDINTSIGSIELYKL